VNVLKPGNVSLDAPGHRMTAEDFLASARASAGILADPELGLGERIFQAVAATQDRVGCNTNLGILLLCAPLAQACLADPAGDDLRSALRRVLRQTTVADTEQLFAAIRLANPGGLGDSAEHDVKASARVEVLVAMAHAAAYDSIACQYATDFADVFERALPHLLAARSRLDDEPAAVTDLFLFLLALIPDSHIQRKLGEATALRVRDEAALAYASWGRERGQAAIDGLRDLDAQLKAAGINPGTTADLTVATLFLDRLLAAPVCHAGARNRHLPRHLRLALCGSPLVSTMSMH
jgi:triphosphoribosyl-dephospho-CoA synthase